MKSFFLTNKILKANKFSVGIWVYNTSKSNALYASGYKYAYTDEEVDDIKGTCVQADGSLDFDY